MTYGWRYFSSYRLNKDELEKYLKKKFGDWNFYIQVGLTPSFFTETMAEALAAYRWRALPVLD